jgi:hypothetical protein
VRITEALDEWNEDSITWANMPPCSDDDTIVAVAEWRILPFDVMNYYRGIKYYYGLAVKAYTISASSCGGSDFYDEFVYFESGDKGSGDAAKVIIRYRK